MKIVYSVAGRISGLEREIEQLKSKNARLVAALKSLSRRKGFKLQVGSNPQRPTTPDVALADDDIITSLADDDFVSSLTDDDSATSLADSGPFATRTTMATPSPSRTPKITLYMRATKASTARRRSTTKQTTKEEPLPKASKSFTICGSKIRYFDGLSIEPQLDGWGRPLDPRLRPEKPPPPPTEDDTLPLVADDDAWHDSTDEQPTPTSDNTDTTADAPADEPYRNWIDYEAPLAQCFDHVKGLEFAHTAFRLGREALWEYARDHHPEFHRRLSRHSPLFIRASYGESERSTDYWRLVPKLSRALEDFARLRNYVSHPSTLWGLGSYDGVASCAVPLLKGVGDVARLQQLRDARAALRVEAENIIKEVEERDSLAELQGGYAEGSEVGIWERYHIDLFSRVAHLPGHQRENPKETHPVVLRAAEKWGLINATGNKYS
jgi:hypothetical protein